MKTIVTRIIWANLLAAALPLWSATLEEPLTPEQAIVSSNVFHFEVSTMRARIGLTLNKLRLLQKEHADLPAVFKDYCGEVAEMAKLAKQTAERAYEMKKEDLAFFRTWEQRTDAIQDPDIQKLAKSRYDRRLKSYRKMVAAMAEARSEFVPFLTSLQDIQKLLESDLNRNTIQSAHKFFKAIHLKGTDLENDLYDVLIEEARVSIEIGLYQ